MSAGMGHFEIGSIEWLVPFESAVTVTGEGVLRRTEDFSNPTRNLMDTSLLDWVITTDNISCFHDQSH